MYLLLLYGVPDVEVPISKKEKILLAHEILKQEPDYEPALDMLRDYGVIKRNND